jgi:hypothetical protein
MLHRPPLDTSLREWCGRGLMPALIAAMLASCGTDVASSGPAVLADATAVADAGGEVQDAATTHDAATVADGATVDALPAIDAPGEDLTGNSDTEDAASSGDVAVDTVPTDPCATAANGIWCLLSLQPGNADFAAPYTILSCAGGKTAAKDLCSLGCKADAPGQAACATTSKPVCGNGKCEAGESCSGCAQDCGSCFPADDCANKSDGNWCGSGFAPPVGTAKTLVTCKNGMTEATTDCTQGCQVGGTGQDQCKGVAIVCGNGQCEGSETCGSCAQDCGTCPPVCGDGTCQAGETCGGCTKDCGACPPACGNGKCETGESCASCAKDCPCADPCAGAASGDGAYCTASLTPPVGPAETLYQCKAKKTASSQVCAYGCHVAPAGVADYCNAKPVDPGSVPTGKGVWVWLFNTTAGSPAAVAQEAKDLGIGFILIKSGEDTTNYDNNFNAQVVGEFTSRGIEVYGWPYVTPGNIDAKAAAVAKSAKIPGVKGIILDVEGEFVGHDLDALDLCKKIRAQAPGVFLGYTSYGWVMYHLNFPYEAFDQGCGDAFLPQTYWDKWTTGPTGGYQKALDGVKYLKLKAPVWAVQDNFGPDDKSSTTTAGLNEFFGVAGPRASLWRWPNPGLKVLNDQLKLLNWKN